MSKITRRTFVSLSAKGVAAIAAGSALYAAAGHARATF
jgi:hypothetical protein